MKSLTDSQLRHLCVITYRLAAMDARALFEQMVRAVRDKQRQCSGRTFWRPILRMVMYARSLCAAKREMRRRGLS
jgi:hypothetical protein